MTHTQTAVILAGAVAKGAFEAGALQVLAAHREEIPVSRIVGASSGALNAAVYAAGIRAAQEIEAAERLVALWQDRADWADLFRLSPRDILALRGCGTSEPVLTMLKNVVSGWTPRRDRPVALRIVLTSLLGTEGRIGDVVATTFEHAAEFKDAAFDTSEGWERIAKTALGSGAFPGVFAPVEVPGVGPCVDGGTVNNTPVKWALDPCVGRIIVVSPNPMRVVPAQPLAGSNLVSDFIDILIGERLYRDLHDAEDVNDYLDKLKGLETSGVLNADQRRAVADALRWRPLELVHVRPPASLDGSSFAGFSNPDLRRQYIEAGREAAQFAIGRHLAEVASRAATP